MHVLSNVLKYAFISAFSLALNSAGDSAFTLTTAAAANTTSMVAIKTRIISWPA